MCIIMHNIIHNCKDNNTGHSLEWLGVGGSGWEWVGVSGSRWEWVEVGGSEGEWMGVGGSGCEHGLV